MLVLSRKVGERVMIDGDIIVEVVEVRGKIVRIGITAPTNIKMWREELLAGIKEAANQKDATCQG